MYDIAIVGAGPAGSIFAKEIARLCPTLTILLIDGQEEASGFRKPCGGLLSPDAQKFLAESALTLPRKILSDPQIFAVETMDLVSGCVRTYQRHYLNMNRYAFDRWLLSLVPSSVEIQSGRCTHLQKLQDGYMLTLQNRTFFAKAVVGADGGGSFVRRAIGAKIPKQYLAIQEWYPLSNRNLPGYSCIFDSQTSDSCSWTIQKDGYFLYGGAFEKQGSRQAFATQKARLEAFLNDTFGNPLYREACLVTSPRTPRDFVCGEPGVYLLGEAAGFISASSFEGISSAMLSGELLALAFSESSDPAERLRLYEKKTLGLRRKLLSKTIKRKILCTPAVRYAIMKSGIQSMNVSHAALPVSGIGAFCRE